MAKFEYEVLVGINYPPNKRAEAGDIVSDLPKDSIPSLMEAGIIKAAGTKKPAIFKAEAVDGDGGGLMQDETIFERPITKIVEAEVSDEL